MPCRRDLGAGTEGESSVAVFRRTDGMVYAKCAEPTGVPDIRDERDEFSWFSATDLPAATVADWEMYDDARACSPRSSTGSARRSQNSNGEASTCHHSVWTLAET